MREPTGFHHVSPAFVDDVERFGATPEFVHALRAQSSSSQTATLGLVRNPRRRSIRGRRLVLAAVAMMATAACSLTAGLTSVEPGWNRTYPPLVEIGAPRVTPQGAVTVDLSASPAASGLCDVLVDGEPHQSVECGSAAPLVIRGLPQDRTFTLTVVMHLLSESRTTSSTRVSEVFIPLSAQHPLVLLQKGSKPDLATQGCLSKHCFKLEVKALRFPPDRPLTVSCNDNGRTYYTYKVRTDQEGSSISEVCYFGIPLHSASVTVDGVPSNALTW